MPDSKPETTKMNQMTHLDKHNTAMTYAAAFEIAAKFIEQFATVEEAAAALEYEAVKLTRKWSRYPVAAPGHREYRSWGVRVEMEPVRGIADE